MSKNTAATTINGTTYTVQGPLPSGTYLLTGPRGGQLMAVPFANDRSMLQVRRESRSGLWSPLTDRYGEQVIVTAAQLTA
jgi:hypothetical protein